MFNRYDLKQLLNGSVSTVVFTKVDGSERSMRCTLIPEYLPNTVSQGQQLLNEDLTNTTNSNTISVWDLDSNAWRSFRVDSVKAIVTHETYIR